MPSRSPTSRRLAGPKRDTEKAYSPAQTAAKLRRLADAIEHGKPFVIAIAGERIAVPAAAVFTIEHEREGLNEEVEFQFRWTNRRRVRSGRS